MQQMIFIADLIAWSTCFGHHYAHRQALETIIQMVAACGIWCFGFQVVGMVLSWRLCVRFAGCCSSLQIVYIKRNNVMQVGSMFICSCKILLYMFRTLFASIFRST